MQVIFFGGEPTLNIEPILYITEELNRFMKETHKDLAISYSISTNGVLSDQVTLNVFSKSKMNVNLSLDGPREIHNYQRPRIDGKPSFDDVLKTLEELSKMHKQKRIHLLIQATITEHTLQNMSLVELAKWFANTCGTNDISFYPVATSSCTAFLKPSADEMTHAWKEFVDYLIDNAIDTGEFPVFEYRTLSTLLKVVLLRAGKLNTPQICPAGLEVLALNYDGDLYACGTAAGEKKFRLAHIDEVSKYEDIKKHYSTFYRTQLRNVVLPCLSCLKKEFCVAVCPVSLHLSSRCEKSGLIERHIYDKLISAEIFEHATENIKKAIRGLRSHALYEC